MKIILTEEQAATIAKELSKQQQPNTGEDIFDNLENTQSDYAIRNMFNKGSSNGDNGTGESSQSNTDSPSTINLDVENCGVSKAWLNQGAFWEAGRPLFEKLDDKHRYGVVVQNRKGQADNKGRHKTYGWGSLYDPFTSQFMDVTAGENAKNFRAMGPEKTDDFLRKCFMKHKADEVRHAKEWTAGHNLTQNQIDALTSIIGNFGYAGFKKLKVAKMIRNNPNDPAIYNEWCNASNRQAANGFGGLAKRRHGEADWYFGKANSKFLQHVNV